MDRMDLLSRKVLTFRARKRALDIALGFLNVPYKFGGPERAAESGPDYFGVDCSGFVCEILRAVDLLPHSTRMSAAQLFGRFAGQGIDDARMGALIFWFRDRTLEARHVCLCIDERLCVGAIGGGSEVDNLAIALMRDARVKVRPLGYRGGRRVICDPFQTRTVLKEGG